MRTDVNNLAPRGRDTTPYRAVCSGVPRTYVNSMAFLKDSTVRDFTAHCFIQPETRCFSRCMLMYAASTWYIAIATCCSEKNATFCTAPHPCENSIHSITYSFNTGCQTQPSNAPSLLCAFTSHHIRHVRTFTVQILGLPKLPLWHTGMLHAPSFNSTVSLFIRRRPRHLLRV